MVENCARIKRNIFLQLERKCNQNQFTNRNMDDDHQQQQSRHERRLFRCMQDLQDFIDAKEGRKDVWDVLEDSDVQIVAANNKTADYTDEFLMKYIEAHKDNKSIGHMVKLYVLAWKEAGIDLSRETRIKLDKLEATQWKPARVTRINQQMHRKSSQYEQMKVKWPEMLQYLSTVQPSEFRALMHDITTLKRSQYAANVAGYLFQEMAVLANKSDKDLKLILLNTRAYCSMLVYTGMRPITGCELTWSDLSIEKDGILVKRFERKCGSTRNVKKVVYCHIVPNAAPRLCTLLHLAECAHFLPQPNDRVFAFGFTQKSNQSDENFSALLKRRFTAVLHAIAIGCGCPNLFSERKLHSFRFYCSNWLSEQGASPAEIEQHIGWSTSIRSKFYMSFKQNALNARTSYLAANRTSKSELVHPMWELVLSENASTTLSFLDKVYKVACATGILVDDQGAVSSNDREEIRRKLDAIINQRKQSLDVKVLLKRIRDLESENLELKLKVPRIVETQPHHSEAKPAEANADEQLVAIVQGLKEFVADPEFPIKCHQQLGRMVKIINANSRRDNFVLKQQDNCGKDLVKMLILGGLVHRFGFERFKHDKVNQSWLNWVDKSKDHHPLIATISTKKWTLYKQSINYF